MKLFCSRHTHHHQHVLQSLDAFTIRSSTRHVRRQYDTETDERVINEK